MISFEENWFCDQCGKDIAEGLAFPVGRHDAEYDLPIWVLFCSLVCAGKSGYGALSILRREETPE